MRYLPLTLLSLLAACSRGATGTEVVVRDSAGVQIIEHPAAAIAAAPQWSLGPAEVTISHGPTEEATFSFVANATRLDDGRMVVIDGDNSGSQVFVYTAAGAFERTLGRPGMGPGEFMFARLMGSAGDTLFFYDTRTSRATWMLTSGALLNSFELARLGMMEVGAPVGALADGRLISAPFMFGDTTDQGARYRQRTPVTLVDPAAQHLDTLSREIPGNEVFMLTGTFGGTSRTFPTPLMYGKRTLFALGRTEVHVATNESSALDTYTLPWALKRSVRFALPRRPVDAEAKKAARDVALANIDRMGASAEAMKPMMVEMIDRAEMADTMAWYAGMGGGADGAVWLREMRIETDSVFHYLVVGNDGHLQGRIDLPKGARLHWAGADKVLIVLVDDDEVPRLELRPIVKGAGAP